MRKSLLIVLLLLTIFSSEKLSAQYQVAEGFEGATFPPAGWSSVSVAGDIFWDLSASDSYYGFQSAFIDYETNGGEDWLKTPRILNVAAGYKLSFRVRRQFSAAFPPDNLNIRVSVTDTAIASFTASLATVNVANLGNDWVQFTYSLAAYAGQNIYIAFKHTNTDGNGCFLDDVTIGTPATADAGISPFFTPTPLGSRLAVGTTISFVDTVKNYGTAALAPGVPVKLKLNSGAVLATVLTTTTIAPGGSEVVTFSGANAFIASSAGRDTVKMYTDLASDPNRISDTAYYIFTVQTPISSYPYFQNFTNPAGWAWTSLWALADSSAFDGIIDPLPSLVGPNGKSKDTAMLAVFYDAPATSEGILLSPLFNFTGVQKPVMNFYVSYTSFLDGSDDSLLVTVSTDGGVTFQDAPYIKSYSSIPASLATVATTADPHVPGSAGSWRHEVVDLSQWGNQPSVLVVFRAVSGFGNYCWIDNVSVVNQNPLYYNKTAVFAPGIVGPVNNKVTFVTTGNAAGGDIVFEGNLGNFPPNNAFQTNTTATAPDNSIFTPDVVYPLWTTVTYSGNDSDHAVYNIAIDITGLPIVNPDKMYFMKRCDQSGAWTCLPTTRVGTVLSTSGLTNFSDFGLGSLIAINPVPIRLLSFEGQLVRDQVNLKWTTANEINNNGFDVERKTATGWEKIGFIQSLGDGTRNANYAFIDKSPVIGSNYYRLKQIDLDGKLTYSNIVKIDFQPSKNVQVFQNSPNPFSTSTTIRYTLAQKGDVKLVVYSPDGKRVATLVDGTKPAGVYDVNWNAIGLSAGTYYYKVITGDNVSTLRMLKIK